MRSRVRRSSRLPARCAATPLALLLLASVIGVGLSPRAAKAGWTARNIATEDLFDVSFPTPARGWAVGQSGKVLATTDGGQTWTSQSSATGVDLQGVDFIDDTHGWAVGSGGIVIYTTNGGASWIATTAGTATGFQDVDFVDASHGWAVGATVLANAIYATTDGGLTWTAQAAPAGIGLVGVSFSDLQHGFAVGFLGAAYRTEDGGQTWLEMVVQTTSNYYAVHRINALEGVIASFQGNIHRTQDGGLTWTVAASLGKALGGIAVAGTSGFVAGVQGTVARSEDEGVSWEIEPTGTLYDLNNVAAASPTSAFAVGAGGTLVEYKSAPPVPLPLDVSLLPESCTNLTIDWIHDAAGVQVAGTIADLDGDGQAEAVVGGPAGLRALHPFVATEQATLWRLRFQARFQYVQQAELDGDPAPELVAATAASGISRSGVLAIAAETGTVLWSRRIAGGSRTLRVADFDGDGLDDVVSVGDGRALSWLSGRDGTDLRPERALNAVASDLEAGRLDGDGVADVVLALSDGKALALNGATGAVLWTYQSRGGDSGGFSGLRTVALGDLTGDGLLDVVVGGAGPPESVMGGSGVVALLDGRQGTLQWDYGDSGGSSPIFGALSLADFNRDGTLDVVAHANSFGQGRMVALDGLGLVVGGTPTGEPKLLWRYVTTRGTDAFQHATTSEAIGVGDGNGDGTPDATVATYNHLISVSGAVPASGTNATGLWEVDRGGIFYVASYQTFAGQPYVFTVGGGDHLVALLAGATGAPAWNYDTGGEPSMVVGDLDGDGFPEIGVGTASGRIFGLDGDGSPLSASESFLSRRIVGLATVDTDGDAALELVGASSVGTVRAVNPRTAATVWERQTGAPATVVASGAGVVAVGTAGGEVIGLAAGNGGPQWQADGVAAVQALVFDPGSGLFAAGDANGDVRFLDATGAVRATYPSGTGAQGGVNAIALADLDLIASREFVVAAGTLFAALRVEGAVVSELWRYVTPGGAGQVAGVNLDNGCGGHPYPGMMADEVVGATGAGDAKAYALRDNGGGGVSLDWSLPNGLPGGIAGLDVDGDDYLDALLGTEAYGFPLANGALQAVKCGVVVATCVLRKSSHIIEVGDFDRDGYPEVAVAMLEGDIYRVSGLPPTGGQPVADVKQTFALPASPNPVMGRTIFAYAIGNDVAAHGPVEVSLTLHDVHGRLVRTLLREPLRAGRYQVAWDAADRRGRRVAAGVYYVRFRAGPYAETSRIVVVK
jgi:photosystem II stability/assembly factor-like uncharacterized protein